MIRNSLKSGTRRSVFAFAILASTAWTPLARAAEFPAVIPLSSLEGYIGFRLDGESEGFSSGISVAGAGDINGDGFADLIIGAQRADPHGSLSGSSYIVFGKAARFDATISLSTLNGTNGFRLDGASGDQSGQSVAGAGDVNGDGLGDAIVGANGASYVVFGKAAGFHAIINLSTLNGINGFRLDSGISVAGAGDVNGDGFGDLIVGARDVSSYVVFGKGSGFAATIDLSTLNGANGFRLDGASGDLSGWSVASAGDVNGDGFADLIVGAPEAAPHGNSSGSTYVVFGRGSGFAATIDLPTLNGTNGFRLDGMSAGDRSGRSVAGGGDVNGDGFADLIVGAPTADPNGVYSGSSYVLFGKGSGFVAIINLSSLDGTNGFRLDGEAYSLSGISVAGAGDVNGDGFADLIIGAPRAGPHGIYSGSGYVVFGKASGFAATTHLSTLNGTNGFRLDGVAADDYSSYSVAGAGDVNGDGFADLIVGAYRADLQSSADS